MKARPSPRGLRAIAGEILLAIAKAILPAPIPPSQRTAVNAILRKVDGEIDGIRPTIATDVSSTTSLRMGSRRYRYHSCSHQ